MQQHSLLRALAALLALVFPPALAHAADSSVRCIDPVGGCDWNPFAAPAKSAEAMPSNGTGNDTSFPRQGPFSNRAADRALSLDESLLGPTGAQQLYGNTPSAGAAAPPACEGAVCLAARANYATGASSAMQMARSAQSLLNSELRNRDEIKYAIQSGGYNRKEIENFNNVFASKRYPTDVMILGLPKGMQDAAYALKISRAIESHLNDTIQNATSVASQASNLGSAVNRNIAQAGSIGQSAGFASARKGKKEIVAITPAGEVFLFGEGGNSMASHLEKGNSPSSSLEGKRHAFDLNVFSNQLKTRPSSPEGLNDQDKSAMAQMLRGLAIEIADYTEESKSEKSPVGQPGVFPPDQNVNSAEGNFAAGGILTSLEMRKILEGSLPLAQSLQNSKGSPFGSIEESIFVRVHRCISKRSAIEKLESR